MQNEASEEQAKQLEASGHYRVLRRILPRPVGPPPESGAKIGVVLDVETTGLDPARDEIIELAMVRFAYSDNDRILGVVDVFQALQQPSIPISPEIAELTGISSEMVKGRAINADAVDRFVADANIVIAHNAAFDRKFTERYWPIFVHKSWACTSGGIDWRKHGFGGAKLEQLLASCGLFYDAHRAADDCHALLTLLDQELPRASTSVLACLLDRARRKMVRVWAQHSPFELKEVLKRRNYRWNDGTDGFPRAWYLDIEREMLDAELRFLESEIYQREVDIHCQEFTALDRYSTRI